MSNATATKSAAAVVLATVSDDVVTADDFREALATASNAGADASYATATLQRYALARYRVAIDTLKNTTGAIEGVPVLRDSSKRDVSAIVWLEATGSLSAPAAKDRTSGETSLGQYLSKFGRVATDGDYGLAYLSGTAAVEEAYDAISKDSRDAKTAKEDRAFTVWLSGQSDTVKSAWTAVHEAMRTEGGKEHTAAMLRDLKPATAK
jgi:hypothetical protein